MLRGLFARLTRADQGGASLFDALVAIAREPHWYVDGEVPDTVDGRFSMLASVVALAAVRLESGGGEARRASVELTERFIAAMDAEHRQMGVSDPAIGKTVRRLVGSLARRVELWRDAVAQGDWVAAARQSVYRDGSTGETALAHTAAGLRAVWERLVASEDWALLEGSIE